MRKRVQIALATLLVAVAGVIAWLVMRPQEREPVYQGKPFTIWLHEAFDGGFFITRFNGKPAPSEPSEKRIARERARDSVRQIGTNSIPTLLSMLRQKDSSLVKLMPFWDNHIKPIRYLPVWIRYPAWLDDTRSARLNIEAEFGFKILGPDGQQAVTQLVNIYEENVSPVSEASVLGALSAIGPAARKAIPLFLLALSDADPDIRETAVRGPRDFGTNAQMAAPALIRLLSGSNEIVRNQTTNALKSINPEATAGRV